MAFADYVLWLDVITALFVLLSLVFLVKNREYERSIFESSINVVLFGLLMMLLVKITDVLGDMSKVYPDIIAQSGLQPYIANMATISGVALLPLFAVCVLMSVIFAKDAFEANE